MKSLVVKIMNKLGYFTKDGRPVISTNHRKVTRTKASLFRTGFRK